MPSGIMVDMDGFALEFPRLLGTPNLPFLLVLPVIAVIVLILLVTGRFGGMRRG
jgi:hypothetical protein